MLAEFDGEGAHQADHAVLGGDVVTGVGVGLQTADRAGHDDRSAVSTGDQMWHSGFDGLPDAGRLTPIMSSQSDSLVLSSVSPPLPMPALATTMSESPELLDAAVKCRLGRVVIADVDLGGDDPAAEVLDQVHGLGEVVGIGRRDLAVRGDGAADVDRDDVGAFLGQPDRVAAPLPRAAPVTKQPTFASTHGIPRFSGRPNGSSDGA